MASRLAPDCHPRSPQGSCLASCARIRTAASCRRSCPRTCARCRPITSPMCCRAISTPSSLGSADGSTWRLRSPISPRWGSRSSGGASITLTASRLRLWPTGGAPTSSICLSRREAATNAAPRWRRCRDSIFGTGVSRASRCGRSAISAQTNWKTSAASSKRPSAVEKHISEGCFWAQSESAGRTRRYPLSRSTRPRIDARRSLPRHFVPARRPHLRYPWAMPSFALDKMPHAPRTVRLKTLITLRWFAVIGQAVTVFIVYYWLEFDLPIAACLSVIVVSAWLNVALRMHYGNVQRLEPDRVAWLLAYDIAHLTFLMVLPGGLEIPFAFFVLARVSIAAISLPLRYTLPLGLFAVATSTLIAFFYWPLPWSSTETLVQPPLYILATWIANLVAIVFIGAYAWQVAEESRVMADALTATELVLAREQHLSQLDGLAAAAAHELGTPLSTIAVVAKELQNALGPNSPHAADMKLLREQAQRCRDILGKLSALPSGWTPFEHVKLSALIEEIVAPHRNFGIAIDVVLPPDRSAEPVVQRSPAILYGLGNLIENAVDFATSRVEIAVRWSEQEVAVTISDDGPGFPPEILSRIGEPYVTSRRRATGDSEESGLGLGFFIAKTLLERSGATLAFLNRPAPEQGAVVRVRWARSDFEVRNEDLSGRDSSHS